MIRIALPTGDLRSETAGVLDALGIGVPDYAAGSRALRFDVGGGAALARVFRERDIPVQIALGSYDIGICSALWVEEVAQRFPGQAVVRLRDFDFGMQELWLASSGDATDPSVRIVSEYPSIAELIARKMRLRRYRIFPVAGAAEAYPPEDADVALIAASDEAAIARHGLRALVRVAHGPACLIANKHSLATKNLSTVVGGLLEAGRAPSSEGFAMPPSLPLRERLTSGERSVVRIALPDGHAQAHTLEVLQCAGIDVEGYGGSAIVRRPRVGIEGVEAKVIRPQDMPQQVAIGNFDLAVTGRDVLFDHLVQFPSSPVEEILDLKRSRYGLAVIVKDVEADSVAGALREWRRAGTRTIRVASELPNIADHFARERHFGRYSVIPVAGASEGFVPDDAEILIEGIETGSSVRANKLTVLERFFESTNCVIANKRPLEGARREVFDRVVEQLRVGAAEPVAAGGA